MAKVKLLLAADAPLNIENEWRETALDLAIESDQLEVVRLLLNKGAKSRGNLENAAENNNLTMVKLLLEHHYSEGYALIYAAENNNMEMVRVLIEAGAKVNISQKRKSGLFSKYYVTPLEMAVSNKNTTMVFYLLDHGGSLEDAINEAFTSTDDALIKNLIDRSQNYDALLWRAMSMNKLSIAEYLIEKGADPRQIDESGNTILHQAAQAGKDDLVHFCLEKLGLDAFAVNYQKETVLMLVVAANNTDLASYLLQKGVHANSLNAKGENALFYIKDNNLQMFELLVQNGADVSQRSINNSSLIINAAKDGNFSIVRFLLENGADISVKNDLGHTAFQYIISPYGRNEELTKLFMERGVDINTTDVNQGKSMMFYAIESESMQRIVELKEKGAQLNTIDNSGHRPSVDEADIVKYLVENGIDLNTQDSRDNTYLCDAIGDENLELAHFLVSKGADVNRGCYFSETPLIVAIKKQNLTLVRFLVENGADIHAIGYFQKNVMEYAQEEPNAEIIAYLKERGAMTKQDRNELYRLSMEMESKIRSAIAAKNQAELASLLKKCGDLVIQESLIKKAAVFAAEEGNPILVELLLMNAALDLNAQVNDLNQTMVTIATINNQTSLVSYLIHKSCKLDLFDAQGKKAQEYSSTKEMRRVYKDAGF
ncbi:MAG: hypothetical protein A3D92_10405 [Bacteroidetes bacterium RIFCSPHIGHO2_02_FULL_44_7]|nr:MAG: hypothetical protein A3D92_10405 [Bacteroidetes bacterium RIFCSPHIGHO2_02_FULL_44_7]